MTCISIQKNRRGYLCVGMGYVEATLDARRRYAKGERQAKCPSCSRYYWADEFARHDCKTGKVRRSEP